MRRKRPTDDDSTDIREMSRKKLGETFVRDLQQFWNAAMPPTPGAKTAIRVRTPKPRRTRGLAKIMPFPAQPNSTYTPPVVTVTGSDVLAWFWRKCPYEVRLEFADNVEKAPPSLTQRLLMRGGVDKEQQYVAALKRRHGDDAVRVIERSRHDHSAFRRQQQETLEAMTAGMPFIVHGFFETTSIAGVVAESRAQAFSPLYRGEPDVLVRVPLSRGQKSRFGKWAYEPLDVKSSRRPKDHQEAQVGYYGLLLGEELGYVPARAGIVVWPAEPAGNDPFEERWFDATSAQSSVLEYLNDELLTHAANPKAFYHLVSGCDTCGYREHCEERARAENDLSLLPGLRRDHKRVLLRAGVGDLPSLAATSEANLTKIADSSIVSSDSLLKHRRQTIAILSGQSLSKEMSIDEAFRLITAPDVHENLVAGFRGARMYLDFESDPLGGVVYLAGFQIEEVGDSAGAALWDHDRRFLGKLDAACGRYGNALPYECLIANSVYEEREMFSNLLDRIDAVRDRYGRVQVVHYGAFERSTLQRLAERHAGVVDAVARVARIETESIDLLGVLRHSLYLPVESYSLKEVAPAVQRLSGGKHGHAWRSPATFAALAKVLSGMGYTHANTQLAWDELSRVAREERCQVEALLGASAALSIYWYRQFSRSGHPVWLDLVRLYNEDDLLAARGVMHWLLDEVERGMNGDVRP